MTDPSSIEELDRRIAIVRDNLRQLIEQAAARSGAADEALASDRIAQQSEELERLTKERDELLAARARPEAGLCSVARRPNLTRTRPAAGPSRRPNQKCHWNSVLAGGPLILTFAKDPAGNGYNM